MKCTTSAGIVLNGTRATEDNSDGTRSGVAGLRFGAHHGGVHWGGLTCGLKIVGDSSPKLPCDAVAEPTADGQDAGLCPGPALSPTLGTARAALPESASCAGGSSAGPPTAAAQPNAPAKAATPSESCQRV